VLLKAAPLIEHPIKIITRRELPAELPPNVELQYGSWHTQALDDSGLRDLYRRAACVVIPLKDSIQPSGQSVALQAMACGTPVVLTKTKGLWEDSGLEDGENVLFIAPGNPQEIVRAVASLQADPELNARMKDKARDYVLRYGRISQFADRMESYCQQALTRSTGLTNNE
jgi:glycosyltransferase involved in cell wall biosynthesis